MENLILTGLILVIIYQIYSPHRNVTRLVKQVEELKDKLDSSQKLRP